MLPVVTAHDLVTASLVYLSIGSALWVVLDGLGIIENTFVARQDLTRPAMILATLMMIVLWPWFILNFFRHMRSARR